MHRPFDFLRGFFTVSCHEITFYGDNSSLMLSSSNVSDPGVVPELFSMWNARQLIPLSRPTGSMFMREKAIQ